MAWMRACAVFFYLDLGRPESLSGFKEIQQACYWYSIFIKKENKFQDLTC